MTSINENLTDKPEKMGNGQRYTGVAFPPETSNEHFLTAFAEEQVISSLFMHRFAEELGHDIITPVLAILKPEHFSDMKVHGWRYLLYKAIYESGLHVDPVNITKWLLDNKLYQKGVEDYIDLICSYNVTSMDSEHYAEAVVAYYNKRNNIHDNDAVKGVIEL